MKNHANKDQPFFLAVGFYRPHVPEVAPKKYFSLYPLSKMKLANESPASLAAVPDYTKAWTPDNLGMSPLQQREMIRAYFAATSFMDAQVGRVLNELKRLGHDKDTIVVFIGDHGYLLGEHGQWMKNILWEEADRVPMIIRAPGVSVANGKSPRTVEMLDLYPTLTDLAGLQPYSRNEGKSLKPLLRQPDASWNRPAFSQIRGGRSVRTERWRYTEWEDGKLGNELYDLTTDPGQHHNLAQDPRFAGVVAQLKATLPQASIGKRPAPSHYDKIHACIGGYANGAQSSAEGNAAVRNGRGAGAGSGAESVVGLKVCEQIDP